MDKEDQKIFNRIAQGIESSANNLQLLREELKEMLKYLMKEESDNPLKWDTWAMDHSISFFKEGMQKLNITLKNQRDGAYKIITIISIIGGLVLNAIRLGIVLNFWIILLGLVFMLLLVISLILTMYILSPISFSTTKLNSDVFEKFYGKSNESTSELIMKYIIVDYQNWKDKIKRRGRMLYNAWVFLTSSILMLLLTFLCLVFKK